MKKLSLVLHRLVKSFSPDHCCCCCGCCTCKGCLGKCCKKQKTI